MRQPTNTPPFKVFLAASRLRVFAFLFPALASLLTAVLPATTGEIHDAIRAGNVEKVKALLAKSPDLANQPDKDGHVPLFIAAREDELEIARILLEHQSDVRAVVRDLESNWHSKTALRTARSAAMVRLLLAHGADINARDASRHTPLQSAANARNAEVARELVDAGAVLDFDSAVELGWVDEVARFLTEKPWLAKLPRTPLHDAARNGDLAMVRLLLNYGADADSSREYTNVLGPHTALMCAARDNDFEIAALLCEHGADPNVSAGRNHDNLLLYAIAYLDAKFVGLLLDHGANFGAGSPRGSGASPLHVAASLGGAGPGYWIMRLGQPVLSESDDRQALRKAALLIERGADVNAITKDGATPLLMAARANNTSVCDLLLAKGAYLDLASACRLGRRKEVEALIAADPNVVRAKTFPMDRSPLHWAAERGDAELVERLLELGADADAQAPLIAYEDVEGFYVEKSRGGTVEGSETPLHVAASGQNPDVVATLLRKGADAKATDWDGATPLHRAATAGQLAATKLLIARGADVNAQNGQERTVLDAAAMAGHLDVVKALLAAGASVNPKREPELLAPLHLAVGHPKVVELLLDAGADVNATSQRNGLSNSALYLAAKRADAKSARLLIARGAKIDLYSACVFGKLESVVEIINAEPKRLDVAVDKQVPQRPIDVAAQHGHLQLEHWLVDRGANPIAASDEASPLHTAARRGHLGVIEYFLKRGVDMNVKGYGGMTPLHAAARGAQLEVVGLLIARGVDVKAQDQYRQTPLHAVCEDDYWDADSDSTPSDVAKSERCRLEIARLLIAKGVEIDAIDKGGFTPLHTAAQHGRTEIAELVISKGADVNARTRRNQTPLALATEQFGMPSRMLGHRDYRPVAELLRRHGGKR